MNKRRQWTGLFAASLLLAACGGGADSGNKTAYPPPLTLPPTPPDPVVIQPWEVTDAGTDQIVGQVLDTLMAYAALGVMMERFGPDLERYIAYKNSLPPLPLPLPPSPSPTPAGADLTGTAYFSCSVPLLDPQLPRISAGSSVTLTDNGVIGTIDSGDFMDISYNNCGDWGISKSWNGDQHVFFDNVHVTSGSLLTDTWSIATPVTPTSSDGAGYLISFRLDQPKGYNSSQIFSLSNGARVERSGAQITTTIARKDLIPDLTSYRALPGGTTRSALNSRELALDWNAPIISVLDSSGRRTMNGGAAGRFDVRMWGLSWFQNARIPIYQDPVQAARVTVQDLQFASIAQLDSRRAERGSITIAPTARTGYSIQVDVVDTVSLRIRVLDVNNVAVSDRVALWDDVIWNYWTATQ